MPAINLWVKCDCGKIHIVPPTNFGTHNFVCVCGETINVDEMIRGA